MGLWKKLHSSFSFDIIFLQFFGMIKFVYCFRIHWVSEVGFSYAIENTNNKVKIEQVQSSCSGNEGVGKKSQLEWLRREKLWPNIGVKYTRFERKKSELQEADLSTPLTRGALTQTRLFQQEKVHLNIRRFSLKRETRV